MTSKEQSVAFDQASRPFALYLHWPFCRAKCPYCDFNSHVSNDVDTKIFGDALCTELTHMASLVPSHPPLSSLFFGGGTPSLMPPVLVERLIRHAEDLFGFVGDIEITAEANPTSVEAKAMLGFQTAGVNRVSMGVQSLDDAGLRFLGREHSAADALQALNKVSLAFNRVSIDLIYALPNQSPKAWQTMLGQALSLGLEHLSLYQLTIESGTLFHTRQGRGEVMALDDDRAADLYEMTQQMTNAAGLPAYEISNHAAIGQECRHNQTYWRAGDWLGVGPGAHGRFTFFDPAKNQVVRNATVTRRSPAGWLGAVAANGHGIDETQIDSPADWANEMVMMGLRLTNGIDLGVIENLCGPCDDWLDGEGVEQAIAAGWLQRMPNQSKLVASDVGRLRLNHILSKILR
ncbi:radical SAM family heme chaperone HemW [Candidatus Puniceispirillum sp.]|nr:radical SAM family heme chaperone HemW [Alphaproteobacteria bacterium]MDC1293698.1 radical SAM family heme chaperone HemW [Candidatus Puniceispirillum sp.]